MIAIRWGLLRTLVLVLAIAPLTACGSDEDEVATDRGGVPEISPEASDELPEGVERVSIEINNGSFGVEELILHEGEPTELEILNRDDEAYVFAIEDLVADQDIPADDTVEIGFTTPDAGTYTGELLDSEGNVVSEVSVEVTGAGGTS